MSSQSNIAITTKNLSKRYQIGKKMDGSLRGTLSNVFKAANSNSDEFWALKNLNFEIKKGDVVGIIGKNGAGKSTLLKVLSQITKPTTGRIEINGRVASLLEVGTGFHPELTGRENIFLNGTILGMSRKEVQEKFEEIVAFSGVEKFIDTAVKHYSSGMYVRLAFSVAAHLEPEILIIDEVLAVGDAEFQSKCLGKMKEVSNQGRTVLFVSHNIAAIKALCNKGIVLKNGQLTFHGDMEKAINVYQSQLIGNQELIKNFKGDEKAENENIQLKEMSIISPSGGTPTISEGFTVSLIFNCKIKDINLDATFELRNSEETIVFHTGALVSTENNSQLGEYSVSFSIQGYTVNAGNYFFNLIFGKNQREELFSYPYCCFFEVENDVRLGNNASVFPGVLRPNFNFKIEYHA